MKKHILLIALSACFIFTAQAQKLDHVLGDVLVQLKPGENIRDLARSLERFKGKSTQIKVAWEVSPPMRIWLLQYDFTTINEVEFLEAVRRKPQVQVAQVNHIVEMRETVPDDPDFNQQWQWVNTGQGGGTPDADVDADLAWDITTGGWTADGREIVVCVVERANRNHVDLQGNLWFNLAEIPGNGIDDDGNGYVDDYNGWNPVAGNDNIASAAHGTTVSGMIGAKGNNGTLITGINWDVKIMHVNVGSLNEANVIAAYTYPYVMRRRYNESGGTQGAFVVATNSSWGIDNGNPANAPLWCAFYDSLGMAGILSCGATTNNNANVDIVGDLPTACPSEFMVAVTATNRNDVRTFSGYGTTHVDVAAPGAQVVSLTTNGGPSSSSGTSFATPLTAGLIALLYSAPCSDIGPMAVADPAGTALRIRDALFQGVDVIPNLINEVKYGGRVNAFNSLQILLETCGPCPRPFGITLSGIIDTTAVLSWTSTDSTLQTNLRWRMVGDSNWIEVDSATSPVVFNNLLPCTLYEFQLEDICADTVSGFTDPFVFRTDGCCEAPKDITLSNLTDTSALFSWNFVLAANSYNLLLTSPNGSFLFEDITETSFSLSGLEPCTEYTAQVQTVCDTGATDFGTLLIFTTPGCGPCYDLTYCPSKSADASLEWIANVSIGDINNSTGSDGGYGDYTGIGTELVTYQAYPISLSPGFSNFSFNEWFMVWIDYNQDGVFDNNEVAFNAGGTSQTTVTGTVIVPGDALPGITRMRVVMKWNIQPVSPCVVNFDFGEVEDYCVTIVPGNPPDCTPPTDLDVPLKTFTTASLSWSGIPDALGYEVRLRRTGTTLWSPVPASGTAAAVVNLEPCTEYEFQVRSLCAGTDSDWTDSYVFTTACYPPCDEIPGGLDTTNVTETSATLIWNLALNANGYRVRYKKSADPEWIVQASSTNTLTLTGLSDCTEYQFTVQALCLGNQESEFADIFFFETVCINSTRDIPGDLAGLVVYPNPFTAALTLEFSLLRSQSVDIELFDALGCRLYRFSQDAAAGNNRIVLDEHLTGPLPQGVYLVKMRTGNGYLTRKVVRG